MAEAVDPGTARLTGGEAIVESLLAHGVDTVFGLPGVQIYGLFDALAKAGDALRVVCPRHEQAAAYMAYGYARSTGRVGVYAVVPGPGMLNSAAALSTAYATSTPLLCVTGQVPAAFIGGGMGHLHELPDQLATLRSLTKFAARIDEPWQAPDVLAYAFAAARAGRPRPVGVEMPWEVFDRVAPVAPAQPLPPEPATPPDPDALERVAALLAGARNPMIMVGSGALGASAEVLALAERLQAPVVAFRGGRGVVPSDHHLGFSCADGFERWAHTDVLLGIGSRLELAWFRWPDRPRGLQTVLIDVDPEQQRRLDAQIGLVGDSSRTAAALEALLAQRGVQRPSRAAEFTQLRAAVRRRVETVQPQVAYLDAIRAALPRDGFFVEEVCQAGFTSYYAFPVYEPRTYVTCGAQGTLGYGYATALGVKVAHPDRAVVSITGDGGFQFGLQELATAAQYGIGLVCVLFDNGAYGNVLRDETNRPGGSTFGTRLRNPDFVALAASYGVRSARVSSPEQLGAELEGALASGEPALLCVPVDPARETSPWPFVMPPSRGGADAHS